MSSSDPVINPICLKVGELCAMVTQETHWLVQVRITWQQGSGWRCRVDLDRKATDKAVRRKRALGSVRRLQRAVTSAMRMGIPPFSATVKAYGPEDGHWVYRAEDARLLRKPKASLQEAIRRGINL